MTPVRNRWRRRALAMTLAVPLLLGAVACSSSSPPSSTGSNGSGSSAQGELLTVAKDTKPNSLDPVKANSHPNQWDEIALAYAPLVHLNTDLSFSSALAQSWEFDKENKNLTFKLRPNLKFADGTPLTAKEVVNSIDYWRKTSESSSSFASTVSGVSSPDASTVVVEQSAPNPTLLRVFSENFYGGSVISPAGLADPSKLETASFGAGPYVMDTAATVPGSQYVYTPNKNYYDPSEQHFKKVVVKIVPGGAPQLQALQANEVDLITVDGGNAAEVAASGLPMSKGAPVAEFGVLLADRDGQLNPAIGSLDVRKALITGVDTKAVCNATFGESAVADANWPVVDAQDSSLNSLYPYDPAKAKQLLASGGYPDGFTVNLEMSGAPPIFATLGQAVAGYWQKLGVDVKITTSPGVSDSQTLQTEKKFETYVYAYGLLPAQLTASSFLTPTGPGAFDPWMTKNADIGQLVAAAPTLPTDQSKANYQQAFKTASEQGWALNACQILSMFAASSKINGWQVEGALVPPFVTAIKPA